MISGVTGESFVRILFSLTLGGGRQEAEKKKRKERKVALGGSSEIGNEDPLCSLAERKRCLILTSIAFKIKLFYLHACRAPQTLSGLLEGERRPKPGVYFIVGLPANRRLVQERRTKRAPGGGSPGEPGTRGPAARPAPGKVGRSSRPSSAQPPSTSFLSKSPSPFQINN